MQNAGFSKVGTTSLHQYPFHIGDTVSFPNGDPTTNDGRRIACPSCIKRAKWLDWSMPLWLFNVLLCLAVLLLLSTLGSQMNEADRLTAETTQVMADAEKIALTIADKQSEYERLCEENAICIRAVQELGMKRPINAAITKISAPPTRFSETLGQTSIDNNEG